MPRRPIQHGTEPEPRLEFPHEWNTRGRCGICGAKDGPERDSEECADRLRVSLDRTRGILKAYRTAAPVTAEDMQAGATVAG